MGSGYAFAIGRSPVLFGTASFVLRRLREAVLVAKATLDLHPAVRDLRGLPD